MGPLSIDEKRWRTLAQGALRMAADGDGVNEAELDALAGDLARVTPPGGLYEKRQGLAVRWMVQAFIAAPTTSRAELAAGLAAWARLLQDRIDPTPAPADVLPFPKPESDERFERMRESRPDLYDRD